VTVTSQLYQTGQSQLKAVKLLSLYLDNTSEQFLLADITTS